MPSSDIDSLLGDLVNAGWGDEAPPTPTAEREYPPLPVRDDAPGTTVHIEMEPQAHGGALMRTVDEGTFDESDPQERAHHRLNVGLVSGLAAGSVTPARAAQLSGISDEDLEGSLALALANTPPEEILKALNIQATQQQLKSGALYGLFIADLVKDLNSGRMKVDDKVKIATMLAKIGRLEPKEDKNAGVGGGFVLNINMGPGTAPITIENEG